MKKYLINKDFLPYVYVERKNLSNNEGNKRSCLLLTIIALFLLPSFMYSFSKEEVFIKNPEVKSDQRSSFLNWLDLMSENCEGKITASEGTFFVEGNDVLNKMLEKENININSMEEMGENKYRLQINQK